MKTQIVDAGTWLYPDSVLDPAAQRAPLDVPRNADVCFQILTDLDVPKGEAFSWRCSHLEEGISLSVCELRPVGVKYNSGKDFLNARSFDEVKDFVTRQAPFEVFDLVRPIRDSKLMGGRVAFFVRVDVKEKVQPGNKSISLHLQVGSETADVSVELCVHNTCLCSLEKTPYGMIHWLFPAEICLFHGVKRGSDEYYRLWKESMCLMADMRNTYVQIPNPIPVYDEKGTVVDFDFSEIDRATEMALELGFPYLCSAAFATWVSWEDTAFYLQWDQTVPVESMEGYRQIKLYFRRTREYIERFHLQDRYVQSVLDEPQLQSSLQFKALVCTFRTLLPGVKLMEAIETPNVAGACDMWVVKQAIYEKYKDTFEQYQAMGENLWVYACGFPANKWMNHIIDLPLSATRLGIWQSVRYGMNGYLHYGFASVSEGMDHMYDTNYLRMSKGEARYFPPGNGHLIYGNADTIYESVRFHVQRMSAQEGELLLRLKKENPQACHDIIDQVCRGFCDYTTDSKQVELARKKLLEQLDQIEKL